MWQDRFISQLPQDREFFNQRLEFDVTLISYNGEKKGGEWMKRAKLKSKSVKKNFRKCDLCGKRTFSPRSNHCRCCAHFTDCMNNRQIHKDAVKEIEDHVRRDGFVCQYTGMKLNMTDPKDPFYFSFDHMIPELIIPHIKFGILRN